MSNIIIEKWARNYKSVDLQQKKIKRFTKFLQYTEYTPEQLLKMSPKEAKDLILAVQAKIVSETNYADNTILTYLSAAKCFFEDNLSYSIKFRKNQLVSPKQASGFHVFSNGDLAKLFEVANVKYKALIAVASSTGFSIDDILHFKKETIQNIIERAKQNGEKFAYFKWVRIKTNVKALAVLNPLAIEWVEKYLQLNPPKNSNELLFGADYSVIYRMFSNLVERASLTLTGKPRIHAIRKWLMSKLSTAGFNEYQIKRCVGKKIPNSDDTYLQTLDDEIKERYPKIYNSHLSIIKTAKIIIQKDPEVKELKRIIKIQQEALQHEVKARINVESLIERQDLSLKEHAKLIEKLSEQLRKLSCE